MQFLNEETVRDSVRFNKTVLVKDIVGTFVASEGLTSSQGTVVSFDSGKQTVKINSLHTPEEGDLITTGTASAIVVQCLTADGELTTGATGRTTGNFIGSKGFVSEDTMRIQDSYYYQDFSYVVKMVNQLMSGVIVLELQHTLLGLQYSDKLLLHH